MQLASMHIKYILFIIDNFLLCFSRLHLLKMRTRLRILLKEKSRGRKKHLKW